MIMAGEPLPQADPIDSQYLALAGDRDVHVELTPGEGAHIYRVTMVAPDRRGLLSKAAGVLALNSLRVHSASVNSHEGSAINTFVVSPHFGSPPAAELLRQQLIQALDDDLDVISILEQRNREASQYGTGRVGEVPGRGAGEPRARTATDSVVRRQSRPGQLLVEIRSTDRTGLLAVLTRVFEKASVDIAWAKVTTLGSSVDDVFCVVAPSLGNGDIESTSDPHWNKTCCRCCRRRRRKKPAENAS